MKKNFTFLFALMLLINLNLAYSMLSDNGYQRLNPDGIVQVTPQEEIVQIKSFLKALQVKEEWIRSNPEEYKIALESGWFENANKTRAELGQRLKELEKKK